MNDERGMMNYERGMTRQLLIVHPSSFIVNRCSVAVLQRSAVIAPGMRFWALTKRDGGAS
jgi:hypothetical protein